MVDLLNFQAGESIVFVTVSLIENSAQTAINRASGLLVSITGGKDLTLFEVDEAANRIREQADPDANIIVGATFDDSLEGMVRVSVVATGIDNTGAGHHVQHVDHRLTEVAGKLRAEISKDQSSEPMPITTIRARASHAARR